MRKFLITYLPALLLLAFLAMVLFTCGGGGGGGETSPAATLTGLSITGPSSMSETSTAMFTAIASWSDNSISMVTPTWSVDSQMASINPGGELCCHGIDNDQLVTITATYSSGEITKTATMDVTITNKTITLTGLSINGPSSLSETSTATYTATASWSDSSTSTVTPTWSVNSQMASISPIGVLSCQAIDSDQMVTVTATYSSGGITETATMDVNITHVPAPHIPFTGQELSGKVFFNPGGLNPLYKLNADSSLEMYLHVLGSPGDRGYYITGTWSNDPDSLLLDFRFADMGPYTVYRIADSSTVMEVEIHQVYFQTDHAWVATWEKTVPLDPAKLPGTYTGSDGYTWVFNANGTGSVSVFGGVPFTWSVDATGVLRMPASNGYAMSFYVRATSQSTDTEYTILEAAFTEHNTSTGGFYAYYGGIELTRK